MRLIAVYSPGITLVAQPGHGRRAAVRGAARGGRRHQGGRARHVPAVPAALLRPAAGPVAVLQHVPVRRGAALEKISGVLDEPLAVPEPAVPAELPPRRGAGRELRLRSVRFGYREAIVLPDMDLRIPAGQTVALVGETGAGKTTVARLVARFYDPGEGSVLLDGTDLRELAAERLRSEVVLVTQENFLFTGSIADNIELGKPGASRAEITAAAKAIGADAFITALPGGYDARGRQARRPAVRGPAPAHLVRAGVPGGARGAGARRGDVAARPPRRAGRAGGAAHDPGRAHRADHRAPAVHGGDRRPGAGDERRARSSRTGRRICCWRAAAGTLPCMPAGSPASLRGFACGGRDYKHAAAAAVGS